MMGPKSPKITTKVMTERLGGPPEDWTFFGQCFDAGEGTELKCTILQRASRYFFTLVPADGGHGSRYISFEAIPLFRYCNPDLHRRLMMGVAFLEIRNDAFDRQEKWRSSHFPRIAD